MRPLNRLIGQVDALEQSDHELVEAVNRLLARNLESAGVYVITFDSATVRLADLIDGIAASEEGYDFVHYTPYARYGRIPVGKTAAEFSTEFARHVQLALSALPSARQLTLVPDAQLADQQIGDVDLTLQLIGRPLRWKVDQRHPPNGFRVDDVAGSRPTS